MKSEPLFVVISAPSGSGKTTICKMLQKRHPEFGFSISATTRPKRTEEKNGREYYFLSPKEFQQKKIRGHFLEWSRVYGAYYGTIKSQVDRLAQKHSAILFDIDTRGGLALKKQYPHAVLIFLLPPSRRVQQIRLQNRGTEDFQTQKFRLQQSKNELLHLRRYDYVVVNARLSQTIRRIESIISAELMKVSRFSATNLRTSSK